MTCYVVVFRREKNEWKTKNKKRKEENEVFWNEMMNGFEIPYFYQRKIW